MQGKPLFRTLKMIMLKCDDIFVKQNPYIFSMELLKHAWLNRVI